MLEITKETIAYSEINNILNHIEKEYYQKIPKKLIDFFKDNSIEYYMYQDDKRELSELAKNILCYLNLEYWSTEDEKEKLIIKYQENQEEIYENYDINEIFENKKKNKENLVKETSLLVKENWLQKLLVKIKKIFKK